MAGDSEPRLTPQTVAGARRSKTVKLGLAVVVLGYLQMNMPLIERLLSPLMGPDVVELLMAALTMAIGLAVVVVRFYTDESLADKGGA